MFLFGSFFIERPDNAKNNLCLGLNASLWSRGTVSVDSEDKKDFIMSLLYLLLKPDIYRHTHISGIMCWKHIGSFSSTIF